MYNCENGVMRLNNMTKLVLHITEIDNLLDNSKVSEDILKKIKMQSYCILCSETETCEYVKDMQCELDMYKEQCLGIEIPIVDYEEQDEFDDSDEYYCYSEEFYDELSEEELDDEIFFSEDDDFDSDEFYRE